MIKMESKFESIINAKINRIEDELNTLKALVSSKKNKPVSLRGMAKILVSEKELEKSIENAKKSLLKGQ
jgi:hypothetical protein